MENQKPFYELQKKKQLLLFAWQNIFSYENTQWALEHFYNKLHKY